MLKLVAGIKGDAQRADSAILAAHDEMSFDVARMMTAELRRRIALNGRPQRSDQRLIDAIEDERNRKVNVSGFTVGLEDWLNRSPARAYWRGLEEGRSHGRDRGWVFGLFVNPNGSMRRPDPNAKGPEGRGKNAIKFAMWDPEGPLPGHRLGRPVYMDPIPAYHYMATGGEQWLRTAAATGSAVETYRREFAFYGMRYFERFENRIGRAPGNLGQ